MTKIRLYTANELRDIQVDEEANPSYTQAFLAAFMPDGPGKFIRNVQTQVACLQVDAYFLPVTINDEEYDSSYVTSPYGVVAYTQEELQRFGHPILRPLLMPLLKGTGRILKKGQINRVVTVNNWMLSTNLYPELSQQQIQAATQYLQKSFPQHSILWRSLNGQVPRKLLSQFQSLPCRLLCSRQVYLFEPKLEKELTSKQRWNIKSDQQLIQKKGYEVVQGERLKGHDIPRLRELYDLLYLEKYTHFNPQFTNELLQLAIQSGLLRILALRKDGKINGVVGYIQRGTLMTTPLFGYDTQLPQQEGLYRMLTALCIQEARTHGLTLHHSSGAAHFKRKRGMKAEIEYVAVFDSHLSRSRRLLWASMETLFNRIGRPLLIRYKL